MGVNDFGFPLDVVGDQIAGITGAFEPQRQANWGLAIGGIVGEEDILLSLESTTLPSVGVDELEINYLNTRRYVAGRAQYDTMPLVVKDFVDVGTATAIKNWHQLVFNPITLKIGLASDYKRVADLIIFAPDGSFARTWQMVGVWPMSVNYGNLDMASSDQVMIEATLQVRSRDSNRILIRITSVLYRVHTVEDLSRRIRCPINYHRTMMVYSQ